MKHNAQTWMETRLIDTPFQRKGDWGGGMDKQADVLEKEGEEREGGRRVEMIEGKN